MPLYDYDCANCGRRFEVIHGVHADPPTSCPLCGGGPVRKAITAAAVHYKGSGWAKKERRSSAAPSKPDAATDSGDGDHAVVSSGASDSPSADDTSTGTTSGAVDTKDATGPKKPAKSPAKSASAGASSGD